MGIVTLQMIKWWKSWQLEEFEMMSPISLVSKQSWQLTMVPAWQVGGHYSHQTLIAPWSVNYKCVLCEQEIATILTGHQLSHMLLRHSCCWQSIQWLTMTNKIRISPKQNTHFTHKDRLFIALVTLSEDWQRWLSAIKTMPGCCLCSGAGNVHICNDWDCL